MAIAWPDMTPAEKSAVITRLEQTGMTHLEIAERYGVSRQSVRAHVKPVQPDTRPGLRIQLRPSILAKLAAAARARGGTAESLCADILTAIVTDDILDAVLDDREAA